MVEKHIGIGDDKDIDYFALNKVNFQHLSEQVLEAEQMMYNEELPKTPIEYTRKLVNGKLVRTVC